MDAIDRINLESGIDKVISSGKKQLAVYPYGEMGRYAEKYIKNRHGIDIVYAVDNKLSDGGHVISTEDIEVGNGIVYLICSSSVKCYEEVRKAIYRKLNKTDVIDLFAYDPESLWYKEFMNFAMRPALYDATYDHDDRIHNAKYTAEFWKNKYIHIDEDDVFAGNVAVGRDYPYARYGIGDQNDIKALFYQGRISEDEKNDYENAVKMGLICRNPGVHATAAYSRLITEGIDPTMHFITQRLADTFGDKHIFYQSEKTVMDGFLCLIRKYVCEAQRLYEATGKNNLKMVADNCNSLLEGAPETFYQGLQLVLFIHLGIVMENGCGSFSFGRIDQYLYPLYKNDIENGIITSEKAQQYLNSFWRKLSEMNLGWQNITIGGEQYGNDECNELTLMCMRAAKAVRGQQPQLSLRVHYNMPQIIWDEVIELISCGMGFPALFNDKVCKEAMKNKGFTEEDSENYSVMGCVELLSEGNEFSHQEGLRFNFVKLLELMMHDGKCAITGKKWRLKHKINPDDISSIEQLMDWYIEEMEDAISRLCSMLDITSMHYAERYHAPFLSAMMNGPLEKGKDVHENGTKYNNLTICGVGIGEIADCMQAIQHICYEGKQKKLSEIRAVLDKDFVGNNDLCEEMLNCEKYGNDSDEVDMKCSRIVDAFVKAATGYKLKYRDGVMQVGFYTSYFHSDFGKLTAASPDGRKKGRPLSPSLSPMAGMDRNGILAVINSANKIDMSHFGNGMALDIKLSPHFFEKEENRNALQTAVNTYFENGGVEMQLNVIDADTLKKAKADPIKYRNIIVRVAGFSARFVDLDMPLQDEIIKRTEHISA